MIKDIVKISHRGMRYEMEDASCLVKRFGGEKDWIFGGVYDGHRGSQTADFAARNLHRLFLKNLENGMKEAEAFRKSYLEISKRKEFEMVGCSALSFLAKGNDLYVANAGDCRMVIVYKNRVDQITKDHRLTVPEEKERIEKAGGKIEKGYAYRGEEGLEPTRSLGDNYFKGIGIISEPEIFYREIPNIPDLYFVAATDGVWDEIENEGLIELANSSRSAREMADKILSLLLSLYSHTSLDNLAMIVGKT